MQRFTFLPPKKTMQRILVTTVLALTLAGCVTSTPAPIPTPPTSRPTIEDRGSYLVNHSFTATGQDERIKFLVFHYTALDDTKSLKILTTDRVSAHYLVRENPKWQNGKPVILQLVDEDKRAWHAGVSNWKGSRNLNDTSIGIEIVNLGYTDDMSGLRTWYPYNEQQIVAIADLAQDIINRHHIIPVNVLGHSDIAPLRKQDPGKLFPWKRLAAMGIGAWPDEQTVRKYLAGRAPDKPADILEIQTTLSRYGYDNIPKNGMLDDQTKKTISAFQMHFRPADISGQADAETEAIAKALVEKYR